MPIPAELCIRCKGYKLLCGLPQCPLLEKHRSALRSYLSVAPRRFVEGATPPSLLVGERGYPRVPVLLQVPPGVEGDRAREYDDPRGWWGKLGLGDIVRLRSYMVSGVARVEASDPWRLYEKEYGLAALSEKPVATSMSLEKPPRPNLVFDDVNKPLGPTARMREARLEDNPRLPRVLERLVWDDLRARDAVVEAHARGLDVYTIVRALSLGFLGKSRKRRLVPTRWAITAVDDMLAQSLLRVVNRFSPLGSPELYQAEYLYNRFLVILLPGGYRGLWVEVWHPRGVWTPGASQPLVFEAGENPHGVIRPPDGGYSAARLPVVEHLYRRSRKAAVVILREILPGYIVPLGNWHIRETVRRALETRPQRPVDLEEVIAKVREWLSPGPHVERVMRSLGRFLGQRMLDEYVY